jgi:hypothetical protein
MTQRLFELVYCNAFHMFVIAGVPVVVAVWCAMRTS